MGLSSQPKIQQVDPNSPTVQPLQQGLSDFLLGVTQGNNPFEGMTSDLQRQSLGGIGQFLNQPSPEQQVFGQSQDALMGMLNQGVQGMGGFDQSNALVNAAEGTFGRNLQTGLTKLSNAAPGRFSSTFASQGQDLTSQALQDFNVFANQARMQGMGLDLNARNQAQQGILGGAGLLGQLAGQAGNNPFQRMMGAGQLGMQATQGSINPMLNLLMGGMGFARPQGMDTVVQPGGGGLGSILGAAAGSMFGPVGTALGGSLAEKLFGKQEQTISLQDLLG